MKQRLDKLLIDRQLVPTREKAQYLIMAGFVLVDGKKIDKCGQPVDEHAAITLLKDFPRYVSRGGEKLEGAHTELGFDIAHRTCLDIGQSTGGFTDFLLQQEARFVFGVDVGYGQLDLKIRNHPKNLAVERTNARNLTADVLENACRKQPEARPFLDKITLVVMDASFISIGKILPAVRTVVQPDTDYIILVKPQFEAEKEWVGRGGIIKDPAIHKKILARVEDGLNQNGFTVFRMCNSPIAGTKGNREFFFWLKHTDTE